MKSLIPAILGLTLTLGASAEPLFEGQVQLPSGAPAAGVVVRLFDLTDLRRSAAATTDQTGRFALPLKQLAASGPTAMPADFALGPNYPNPFNPATYIPYQLPAASHVRLEVYNLLGQRVATLVDGVRPAGYHTAYWNATDAAGQAVAAGIYLYRLRGGGGLATRSMLLIDGQAGGSATDRYVPSVAREEAAEGTPIYGLTISGPGLVPFIDPAFRWEAGMPAPDLVVDVPAGVRPAKAASTSGILGDVDNTGRVDFIDALLVAVYSLDPSVVMPNNGDISLGDVNADGRVDLADAWLIGAWLNDPSDPTVPAGIGEPAGPPPSLAPDPSTVTFADDGAWHRFTVQAREPVSVVANPEGPPRLEITTRAGRGNYCPAEVGDDASRQDGEAIYLAGCATGPATLELRREADGTVLQTYTIEVTGLRADLVVSASVSDSTLTPGQSFTLSARVRNQGQGAAAATTLRYYRSSNRTISTGDTQVGADGVGALAASGASAESIHLTAPASEGTWYYGACVQSIGSEIAGNNCSDGVRVTVKAMRREPGEPSTWSLPDGAVARLGKGRVEEAVFSPDGQLLAVASGAGIWLYDAATLRELALLDHRWVRTVAFSPDGRLLASGSFDRNVILWDLESRRQLATLEGHTSWVRSVAFSPDGRLLASGSNDTDVILWDVESRRRLATLVDHTGWVSSVAFSPDSRLLASGAGDSDVILWEVSGRRRLATLQGHTQTVFTVAFSPDGRLLASGSFDENVILWDVSSRRRLAALEAQPVLSVAFSPDGALLASGAADGDLILWDVSGRRRLATLSQRGWFSFLSFSPDGALLASGSVDGDVILWDVGSRRRRTALGHAGWPYSVAFSPDGRLLASGAYDDVILWDVSSRRRLATLGQGSAYYSVSFSPDGRQLASGSHDGDVILWDVSSRNRLAALQGHTNGIPSVAFSPDGALVASGAYGGEVILWNVSSRRRLDTIQGTAVSFSPDGALLASGAGDGDVILWDASSRRRLATLKGHTEWVRSVAFSRDGRLLASGSNDTDVILWDVESQRRLATLQGHTETVFSVAFSPDGRLLASGSNDTDVVLWDVESRRRLATLVGHTGWVSSVAFSPDGQVLASASIDGTILLWETPADVPAPTLISHDDRVVVMSVPGSLQTDEIDFDAAASVFFTRYEDAFDYLMFFSNLSDISDNQVYSYYGIHMSVQNTVQGTGKGSFSRTRDVGSAGKLNALIHFPYNSALLYGPSLHEILHSWANYAIPTVVRAHWGFSGANGQLGGFDPADLVDHGGGRYSAGDFGTFANGGNSLPYSPIELYFAGLIPPSEVPDLWVAEDGAGLWENDELVRDDSGHGIFTASKVSTWSIDRIAAEHGARIPDSRNSQKSFRAAAILLVDQAHPAQQSTLDEMNAAVQQFSRAGHDNDRLYNFWEATGGRATLAMDGLSTYRKAAAGKPTVSYRFVKPVADLNGHIGCGRIGAASGKWMAAE